MKRIEWVDFGKGFTILFVVLSHVLDGLHKTAGLESYENVTKILMAAIFTFIMPVFFALSGYVYHPTQKINRYFRNIGKKAINLFVPYVIFSVVYVVLQHLSGSVHTLYSWGSLLYIFKQPIGYLWFLYILFFVFVLVGFLDLLKINMYLQGLVYLLLFIGSQYISLPYVLSRTFTWTICFYIGFMIKQVHLEKKIQNVFFVIAAIIFLMGAMQQYFAGGDWYHTNLLLMGNFLTKISSIPIAFYFFSRLPKTSVFDYFVKYGKYSLIIYLIHAPVTSIVRVILLRVGLSNYFVLMVGITVITWYVSVFVCWLSQKISLIDMVFSPYKYIAHRKVPA